MKSKIGYNLLGQGADPIELIKVAKPAVVLCMKLDADFLAKIKPYCGTIVLRKFFDGGFQTFSNPKADAKKAFDSIIDDARRLKLHSNLWMIWNESAVWNPTEARNLRDFYNEIARLFHAEGLRVGAYSFPEGNPADLKLWRYLLDTDCDYIFLHEYDYPTIDAEGLWHVGRWQLIDWNDVEPRGNLLRRLMARFSPRKMRAAKAKKRVLINEGVLDGKVRHKNGETWGEIGWQAAMTEEQYIEQLKKLDAMLQADPNVEGLCLFADRWDQGNGTYNHDQAWKVAKYIGEEMPMPNRPRAQLWALLRSFEKFSAKPYWDRTAWRNGYGHTTTKDAPDCTREQAYEWLKQDADRYVTAVELQAKDISDNEWIALCSLCFNIGIGAFNASTLLEKLGAGDRAGAAREFLWYDALGNPHGWVKAGGKVLPGLVERRAVERDLFLGK